MIRRSAQYNSGTAASPIQTAGFVLAWLVQVAPNGNESMVIMFEESVSGLIKQIDPLLVAFEDGAPAVIPEIP